MATTKAWNASRYFNGMSGKCCIFAFLMIGLATHTAAAQTFSSYSACAATSNDQDTDWDGRPDPQDLCPFDSTKIAPGVCGCGISDYDSDGDSAPDNCGDACPTDPLKFNSGVCGCGVSDIDYDCDGVPDCQDICPFDSTKINSGICGCGASENDSDGDGSPDCFDSCPNDPSKNAPGVCGCGVSDMDSDGDGVPDCQDTCPFDTSKIYSGVCGCGALETDTDGDGSPDCVDFCPNDQSKSEPGICGCGLNDFDQNGNGVADCAEVQNQHPIVVSNLPSSHGVCPLTSDSLSAHAPPLNYLEEQEIALSHCNDFSISQDDVEALASTVFKIRDSRSKEMEKRVEDFIAQAQPRTECAIEKIRRAVSQLTTADVDASDRLRRVIVRAQEIGNRYSVNSEEDEPVYDDSYDHRLEIKIHRPDKFVSEYKLIEQVTRNGCSIRKIACRHSGNAEEGWAFETSQDVYTCIAYSDNCLDDCREMTWPRWVVRECLTFSWGARGGHWCKIVDLI